MFKLKKPLTSTLRRELLTGGAAAATVLIGADLTQPVAAKTLNFAPQTVATGAQMGNYIDTKDGTQLYYKG